MANYLMASGGDDWKIFGDRMWLVYAGHWRKHVAGAQISNIII